MQTAARPAPGKRFTKVYSAGWKTLAGLVNNRPAAALYVFLADQMGHDNALVCTIETIAEELNLSKRTIYRAVDALEAAGHVFVGKIGTANVYVLNPEEVWKTVEEHKHFCAFSARTLVSNKANPDFKKRLTYKLAEPRAEVAASERAA